MLPRHTRLRWVEAKSPQVLQDFCESLGRRVQIYSIQPSAYGYIMFFVPDDRGADIKSGRIKSSKKG